MIKFFRHIRQRLLAENRVSKYMVYAVGEIVLVVIGILIALGINNWNQDRKDRIKEGNYVELLIRDLSSDAVSLNELIGLSDQSVAAKNLVLAYQEGSIDRPDSLSTHFIRATFNGITSFVPNTSAIREIQSAGGLALLKNDAVREQILRLYNEYERMEKNVGNNYLQNRQVMRDLIYAKANGNLFLNNEEVSDELLMPLISDSELRNRLINNWAITYNRDLKALQEINAHTIQICRDYLSRFK